MRCHRKQPWAASCLAQILQSAGGNGFSFPMPYYGKTGDKKEDSVNRGDRCCQAYQHQRSAREPGHKDGDGNPDAEGRGNSLDHYGNASSPPVEITDAAEQYAGEDAFCGEALQVVGTLADNFLVIGESGGQDPAAEESGEKDYHSRGTSGSHGGKKSPPGPFLLPGSRVLRNEGGYALHDGRGHQHNERDDLLGDSVSCGGHKPHVIHNGVDYKERNLYHGLLDSDGDPYIQDPSQLCAVDSALCQGKGDGKFLSADNGNGQYHGDELCQNGCQCSPGYIHLTRAHEEQIPDHVHDTGNSHKEEGQPGISDAAQDTTDYIVGGDYKDSRRADAQIQDCFIHGFGRNLKQPHGLTGKQFQHGCHYDSDYGKKQDRGTDCVARFFWPLLPYVLSDDYGRSHSKTGDNKSYHLHKAASGSHCRDAGRIPEPAYHDQIHGSVSGLQDKCTEYRHCEAHQRFEYGTV